MVKLLYIFYFKDISGHDDEPSIIKYSSKPKSCNEAYSPEFFDINNVNCFNLILEDNFVEAGKGRATIYVLGKIPVCLSCFDVPSSFIKNAKYISFSTKKPKNTELFYNCPELNPTTGAYVNHDD